MGFRPATMARAASILVGGPMKEEGEAAGVGTTASGGLFSAASPG